LVPFTTELPNSILKLVKEHGQGQACVRGGWLAGWASHICAVKPFIATSVNIKQILT
jgi:hypothetical protein